MTKSEEPYDTRVRPKVPPECFQLTWPNRDELATTANALDISDEGGDDDHGNVAGYSTERAA